MPSQPRCSHGLRAVSLDPLVGPCCIAKCSTERRRIVIIREQSAFNAACRSTGSLHAQDSPLLGVISHAIDRVLLNMPAALLVRSTECSQDAHNAQATPNPRRVRASDDALIRRCTDISSWYEERLSICIRLEADMVPRKHSQTCQCAVTYMFCMIESTALAVDITVPAQTCTFLHLRIDAEYTCTGPALAIEISDFAAARARLSAVETLR